jgi:5-methylcytosine-specific restriction enzyme subunit McrC
MNNYDNVSRESFDSIEELFAAILTDSCSSLIKQGLYKEYVNCHEDLHTLRGKLDIQNTIKNRIAHNNKISCEYDELSENNLFNQILKTALLYLIRSNITTSRQRDIRNLISYMGGIDALDAKSIRWDSLRYQRNNRRYKLAINMCYFLLSKYLPTSDKGDYLFQTLSEDNMSRLYEKFVLNYYCKHHPNLNACADYIKWDLDEDYQNIVEFLPSMKSDIILSSRSKTLIIDTKYYSHMTQRSFDKATIHSANLYQIFTYVKNKDRENNGSVSGMLLYAKTVEEVSPNLDAKFNGNIIMVRTLDLNTDFANIKCQLDEIAKLVY